MTSNKTDTKNRDEIQVGKYIAEASDAALKKLTLMS
jgi:hypothetical protein